MLRTLLPLAAVLVLACVVVSTARADEVFVLDNGMVLRGTALKESEAGVVIRLADFVEDARVTVEPSRIVRRFGGHAAGRSAVASPMSRATDVPGAIVDVQVPPARGWAPALVPALPLDETETQREGLLERAMRQALLALPSQPAARAALTGLGFLALAVLVLLGGGLLEIEGLTMLRSTLVASAFGGLLLLDGLASDELLRPDRIAWVLPAQAAGWALFTWTTLRCSPTKVVLLLAFLGFCLGVLAFTAGAVLLSF